MYGRYTATKGHLFGLAISLFAFAASLPEPPPPVPPTPTDTDSDNPSTPNDPPLDRCDCVALGRFREFLAGCDARSAVFGDHFGVGVVDLDVLDYARLDALLVRHHEAERDAAERAGLPYLAPPPSRWDFLKTVVSRGLSAMEADLVNHVELGDFARIIARAGGKA
jgi:hypothetical protein